MLFKNKERSDEIDNIDLEYGITMDRVFKKIGISNFELCYPWMTEFGILFVSTKSVYDKEGNKIIDKGMINHDNLAQFKKGTSSVDMVMNAIKNNTANINGKINNIVNRRKNESR